MPERVISTHPADIDYVRRNIPCQWGCPARTNIPAYIDAICHGAPTASYAVNRRSNLLPGVLGRICSRPCEEFCRHGDVDLGEPVSICWLKRAAADRAGPDHARAEYRLPATGKRVAVVGGGPSGLAVAHSLALFGHGVTILEMMPRLGGMLLYGIPRFRLPDPVIAQEAGDVIAIGVEVKTGFTLGVDATAADLLSQYDAVVLAAGCYDPYRLDVPGEDLPGVYSGLDFMMRVNRGDLPEVGDLVIVIGGGFTAMDCARTTRRLGASRVEIDIRETEEDLVVSREEVLEAKREGIRLVSLVAATELLGDTHVTGIRFARTRLRTDSLTGMKIAHSIPDSEFDRPVDTVITAIGQRPSFGPSGSGLPRTPTFDPETGESDVPGLYAAGDYRRAASTVIQAIGSGSEVAERVDEFLTGARRRRKVVTIEPWRDTRRERAWDFAEKTEMPALPVDERLASRDVEVETGYGDEAAAEESRRCYLCNLKYEIKVSDCIYCRWCIDLCPRECIHLVAELAQAPDLRVSKTGRWNRVSAVVIDSDRCIRCGVCLRICPTQCISVKLVNLVDEVDMPEGPFISYPLGLEGGADGR